MAPRKAAAQKADINLTLSIEDQAGRNVKLQMGDTSVTLPKKKLLRVVFNEILGHEAVEEVHRAPRVDSAHVIGRAGLITPPLGQEWSDQGGVFVGTIFDPKNGDYHLIVGPEMDSEGKWQNAVDWAKTLIVAGHNDFDLPNKREGRFLQCNGKHLFQDKWYWLGEQYAGGSDYAWAQLFESGNQDYWTKRDYEFRARAVRRVPIQ